jgi:hypothetical protein
MDFWELQDVVVASLENIAWLQAEMKREKKRKRRLHNALIAVSEKANKNSKVGQQMDF